MVQEIPTRADKAASQFTSESILRDYRIGYKSRQASLIGRREVLTGKAKFGIFGDGKEVAQVAMARAFRPGDVRSGYYRDQTVMFALGLLSIEEFFAQLYADPSSEREPASSGRQMTAHFATRFVAADGSWRSLKDEFHSSADLSPTGSQMPRMVGLAQASKLYREMPVLSDLDELAGFSDNGDEVVFGTIGNASCAEGLFWESVNAAGVLGIPMLLSIWDDGYGISVPNEYQVTKGDVSGLLRGFQRGPGTKDGYDVYTVRGWDYPSLCETYLNAAEIVRREHVPAIVHVREMTQPQGHSTSGSHERYKSPSRLDWEEEFDCLARMRDWMLRQGIVEEDRLEAAEKEDLHAVREAQRSAWDAYRVPLDEERREFVAMAGEAARGAAHESEITDALDRLGRKQNVLRRDLMAACTETLLQLGGESGAGRRRLVEWRDGQVEAGRKRYDTELYSSTARSAVAVAPQPSIYPSEPEQVSGFEILQGCFDAALARHPHLIAFGEDVGKLGDVNQGMAGLQKKYGPLRVADTGIREATIMGQAIGLAMRGFRPLAEIQYLDYLLYGLQILSDDLATLRWRTRGIQKAPVIVRTRGHRLEGVWHSGSPMGGLIHFLRGMYLCVPRDMTRAAGFYNTLLESEDPAIVVEVLNGYRNKEPRPENIAELRSPLGIPEVIRAGSDLTLVTYGACCRLATVAAELLERTGVDVEIIDVQTLLPFDVEGRIVESLKRTNRVLFVDEDVPGGATAFMMQQVLERQGGYDWLDAPPATLTSREHRPAYGSDGDYFSKPSREDIFHAAYGLMHRADPARFPALDAT